MKRFLPFTAFVIVILIIAAGVLWSGAYNFSARDPHWTVTTDIIAFARDRSIIAHSESVKVSSLDDPKLLNTGVTVYHETCRLCHGAPGVPSETMAQGLYPAPTNLLSGHAQKEYKDNQLYWIVENGLKMTGMPAFGDTYNREELLGVTAVLKHLPGMSAEKYRELSGGPAGSKIVE